MSKLDAILSDITPVDINLAMKTKERLDNLTKPIGSLGRLEDIAIDYVSMTGNENPDLSNKYIFTLAGDHGVTEEGVSAYPKEVTAQMVYNFLRGGAGINILARHVGAEIVVVDMGLAEDIKYQKSDIKNFIEKKIDYGTKNMAKGPAMTRLQAIASIEAGIGVFLNVYSKRPIDIIGIGEMGIGNTTSASAIVCAITGKDPKQITGKGTGITDEGLKRKVSIIKKAMEINKPNHEDAIDILSKIGGFEIGGLCGIALASASKKVPVVLDGFISSASAYLAYKISPHSRGYMFASHNSVEMGHKVILDSMRLKPLLDLNLRLGEGTGAALGIGLVDASLKILTQMATFKDAGVSEKLE